MGYVMLHIYNSVIHNNDGHGIYCWSSQILVTLHNSIVSDNGGYGVSSTLSTDKNWNTASNNCWYNNTSGACSPYISLGIPPGYGNITEDPMFHSTQSGGEDFRLKPGSPCKDLAMGYRDGF